MKNSYNFFLNRKNKIYINVIGNRIFYKTDHLKAILSIIKMNTYSIANICGTNPKISISRFRCYEISGELHRDSGRITCVVWGLYINSET